MVMKQVVDLFVSIMQMFKKRCLNLNSYFLFLLAKVHVFLENTNKKKEKMQKK